MSCEAERLPKKYLYRMKKILGSDFEDFLECCNKPHYRGIRINPLKCREEVLKRNLPFSLLASPFSPLSYYIPNNTERVGALPMHHAGAFYSQEPSASSAVTVLNPVPGDIVLDLCAAPGGKSTQIASLLRGEGLLWSNEIIKSRANILLSNIERCGVANAVVSSCHPDTLCSELEGFFDKILVDAPCSGEGMFRRDDQAILDWSEEHVQACAVRQLAILESAAKALKENGIMVYSTCTFSVEENEGVINQFLSLHKDFELVECGQSFGRPAALKMARRIFPMDGGEGHFVARLKRLSYHCGYRNSYPIKKSAMQSMATDLYHEIYQAKLDRQIEQIGNSFILLPEHLPELKGLGVIRAGILLGEGKTNRVEPAHAAFMAAKSEDLNQVINLPRESNLISAFLKGEEIDVDCSFKGFTGVAVDGVVTGFGKASNGRLKNHYPKGLRNN